MLSTLISGAQIEQLQLKISENEDFVIPLAPSLPSHLLCYDFDEESKQSPTPSAAPIPTVALIPSKAPTAAPVPIHAPIPSSSAPMAALFVPAPIPMPVAPALSLKLSALVTNPDVFDIPIPSAAPIPPSSAPVAAPVPVPAALPSAAPLPAMVVPAPIPMPVAPPLSLKLSALVTNPDVFDIPIPSAAPIPAPAPVLMAPMPNAAPLPHMFGAPAPMPSSLLASMMFGAPAPLPGGMPFPFHAAPLPGGMPPIPSGMFGYDPFNPPAVPTTPLPVAPALSLKLAAFVTNPMLTDGAPLPSAAAIPASMPGPFGMPPLPGMGFPPMPGMGAPPPGMFGAPPPGMFAMPPMPGMAPMPGMGFPPMPAPVPPALSKKVAQLVGPVAPPLPKKLADLLTDEQKNMKDQAPTPCATPIPEERTGLTDAEQKEYEGLADEYVDAMGEIEEYGIYAAIEKLCERSVFNSHKDDAADPTSDNAKKIMKEIRKNLPKNIYSSLEGSMFVRFDENNPRFLQAMLTGLDGTPYESGCFLFDIYLSDDYPMKPPMIKHISKGATQCKANNGPGGFSPNLHKSTGKVCLSLLGTWQGPGWEAGKSNVYQILSTVLFMIFGAEHPYYMEPSYGGWEGTVLNKTSHEKRVYDYDEEVMFHNAKHCILDAMKNPYPGFEDVIKSHFKLKAKWILKTIERWMECKNYQKSFKAKMQPIYEQIKQELKKLE